MPKHYPPNVVFQAIGQDSRIAKLDSLTNTPLYNKKQQLPAEEGGLADFVELAVVRDSHDEHSAVEEAQAWIEKHRELLQDLDADKMLEFQTGITPECGSKALVLPAPFVKLIASIDVRLVHQYSQSRR